MGCDPEERPEEPRCERCDGAFGARDCAPPIDTDGGARRESGERFGRRSTGATRCGIVDCSDVCAAVGAGVVFFRESGIVFLLEFTYRSAGSQNEDTPVLSGFHGAIFAARRRAW